MTRPPSDTDFGYERIRPDDKRARVRSLFDAVAPRYDLMNDLLSLGLHRLWKRAAIERTGLRPGQRVLDVAAGTGDLARLLVRRLGAEAVLVDPSPDMLRRARAALRNEGILARCVCAAAEQLPFPDGSFDAVTVGFGLRNFTDRQAGLGEMARCLRPGGRLVILEFSHPTDPLLRRLYDSYSFELMPRLGEWVAGQGDAYRYLAESIRVHPPREELVRMMREAGLERCRWSDMSGGIVAIHWGVRRV
ncbi:MAG: bifunctional demethylmenaquinone methyltransferase/2-methoxy-6-polyprenyl-1,4-benzoquinol methylase UbiE [Gammaproteobacteria bacterium AqS3]|nr:bifunctional demethylmenaquinone methyltransferase/2-methoxy-6-polyprenyl-1,4-benzoquinol methylase UbiE [Gammaproteobacteria bacterium AqS3]